MSCDSNHLAQLKLVISVNCRVDSALARCRCRKGVFQSLYFALTFPCKHLFYDISVASPKVSNL